MSSYRSAFTKSCFFYPSPNCVSITRFHPLFSRNMDNILYHTFLSIIHSLLITLFELQAPQDSFLFSLYFVRPSDLERLLRRYIFLRRLSSSAPLGNFFVSLPVPVPFCVLPNYSCTVRPRIHLIHTPSSSPPIRPWPRAPVYSFPLSNSCALRVSLR